MTPWNSTTFYANSSLVIGSDNNLYISLLKHIGQDPTSTSRYWRQIGTSHASSITAQPVNVIGPLTTGEVPEWDGSEWNPVGGLAPIETGRPKLADGTTFYGLPFCDAWDGGWQTFLNTGLIRNKIYYSAGVVFSDPIHVSGLELISESYTSFGISNGDTVLVTNGSPIITAFEGGPPPAPFPTDIVGARLRTTGSFSMFPSGTTVLSVDSPTQITASNPANADGDSISLSLWYPTNIRVGIFAADLDWRPQNDPLYQHVLTFAAGAAPGTVAEVDTDFVIPAGRYMVALQQEFNSLVGFPSGFNFGGDLRAAIAPFAGSSLCAHSGGAMLQMMSATRPEAVFSAPMPLPDTAIFTTDTLLGDNGPMFALFFEWDPA